MTSSQQVVMDVFFRWFNTKTEFDDPDPDNTGDNVENTEEAVRVLEGQRMELIGQDELE